MGNVWIHGLLLKGRKRFAVPWAHLCRRPDADLEEISNQQCGVEDVETDPVEARRLVERGKAPHAIPPESGRLKSGGLSEGGLRRRRRNDRARFDRGLFRFARETADGGCEPCGFLTALRLESLHGLVGTVRSARQIGLLAAGAGTVQQPGQAHQPGDEDQRYLRSFCGCRLDALDHGASLPGSVKPCRPPARRLRARPKGGALQAFAPRSRSALAITETDEKLIAAAASMGESSQPVHG